MGRLSSHSWPGNLRELENLIMRACALYPGLKQLDSEHLPLPDTRSGDFSVSALFNQDSFHLPDGGIQFEEVERKLLLAAWEQSGQSQTTGAKLLGLPRQAFIYRLQKFGVLPPYGNQEREAEK